MSAAAPDQSTDAGAGQGSQAQPAAATPFDQIGGEPGVRALVDRFYDLMDLQADKQLLRGLHPQSLDGSRDKLFWFLCGWLGGPDLYQQRFGHPRLRARHLPYSIGIAERDQWMSCMLQAMTELEVDPVLAERLANSFFQTADWMRNRGG